MSEQKKPLVLLVLDGYGHSDSNESNAIQAAKTPIMDHLRSHCPTTLIATSGLAVGLPEGQMGNSEVGHMTLGAGRVIYQSFTRINKAIADGDFFANPAYSRAIDNAISGKNRVHILGLLSQGGVHSHEDHINAMVDMAAQRGAKEVYVHAFLDGRDTPPRSAEQSLQHTAAKLAERGVGRIASICGRLLPTLIADDLHPAVTIRDGDTVLFMNFRPDRAREMTRALVDKDFSGFSRTAHPALGAFVMTTEYAADIQADCAFPPEDLHNTLGEYLSNRGMTQLRIAETEKYAHVTFFFNGGQETLFRGEDRILIPSPKVATYDLKPEMSAYELTDELVKAITGCQYDVIICNYANCDQVGHSGVFDAAVKAVEVVDTCLDRVLEALRQTGGECLITADHGNVEQMFDKESGQVHTQHTTLPVLLIYVGQRPLILGENGSLADVAATLLDLLDLPPPPEMTGHSLVSFAH